MGSSREAKITFKSPEDAREVFQAIERHLPQVADKAAQGTIQAREQDMNSWESILADLFRKARGGR